MILIDTQACDRDITVLNRELHLSRVENSVDPRTAQSAGFSGSIMYLQNEHGKNSCFCCLLIFSKSTFLYKFFQEYHIRVSNSLDPDQGLI